MLIISDNDHHTCTNMVVNTTCRALPASVMNYVMDGVHTSTRHYQIIWNYHRSRRMSDIIHTIHRCVGSAPKIPYIEVGAD